MPRKAQQALQDARRCASNEVTDAVECLGDSRFVEITPIRAVLLCMSDFDTKHCTGIVTYERLDTNCCYSSRLRLLCAQHISCCCEDITRYITVTLLQSSRVWKPKCPRCPKMSESQSEWSRIPLGQDNLRHWSTAVLDVTWTCFKKPGRRRRPFSHTSLWLP